MSHDLKAHLGTDPIRPRVVSDCAALIDAQVKAKRGVSGVAIKGAYGTIKRIKKGIIPEVVEGLLDEWLEKLQPYHDAWSSESQGAFRDYLVSRSDNVAEDLLTVTDARAEKTKHKTAAKAYRKMRGSAKSNVVESIPGLADVVQKHIDSIDADADASG